MLTNPEGPFINLSRINLSKYSQKPSLSRVRQIICLPSLSDNYFLFHIYYDLHFYLQTLFEYIFHHENDVKNVSVEFICATKRIGLNVFICGYLRLI